MSDAAANLIEAQAHVERIAQALWERAEEVMRPDRPPIPWKHVTPETSRRHMEIVRRLLLSDVIRVGYVPRRGDPPMDGQTTIEGVQS